MFKANAEAVARSLAAEHGLSYGHCVFDGKWYVGTRDELARIGVVIVEAQS